MLKLNRKRQNVGDILTKYDDSKRAVAKLMARENITVQIVDGAPTAMFDTVRRVLTIPNWTSLTVDQFDHLIGHEVGHALFTDNSFLDTLLRRESKGLMSYFNIVEDARIERKMKACYPGLGRIFYNSYEEFHKNGPLFKGNRTHLLNPHTNAMEPIAKMTLIDRINLFYKIGAFTDIPFAQDERQWIHRIDKCADINEALEIAKALHKLAKEERQKQQQDDTKQSAQKQQSQDKNKSQSESDDDSDSDDEQSSKSKKSKKSQQQDKPKKSVAPAGNNSDDSDEDEDDDDAFAGDEESEGDDDEEEDGDEAAAGDEDGDEEEESSQPMSRIVRSNAKGGANHTDEDPVANTDRQQQEILEKLAEVDTQNPMEQIRHLLCAPMNADLVKARTITAADWAERVRIAASESAMTTAEQNWNKRFLSTAKQMAQEFERRKNAKAQQRAQTARTGRLDMRKLHQYKYTEDLFLRSTILPNGQSHGIVMIVDASGSMRTVFPNVLDQVLLFAHFAHATKIPFEAYMFTDANERGNSYYASPDRSSPGHGPLTLDINDGGKLVGLINTVTDRGQFRKQFRAVLALQAKLPGVPFANLGGTPLYTGIMLAERHIARMKRTLKLDKMVFVVISDGGDGHGLRYEDASVNVQQRRVQRNFTDLRYNSGGIVVRDTLTKKNYAAVSSTSNGRTTVHTMPHNGIQTILLDIIRDRHDVRVIYIYLHSAEKGAVAYANGAVTAVLDAGQDGASLYAEASAALKTDGQYVLPSEKGLGDLAMILSTWNVQLTEDAFEKLNATNMSQERVGDEFTKAMTQSVNNRKFVRAVIPFIA